jgi:hypothetical protein
MESLYQQRREGILEIVEEGKKMNWTKEKPTKNGWYWCLEKGETKPQIINIEDINEAAFPISISGDDVQYKLEDFKEAQWYGPLEPPTNEEREGPILKVTAPLEDGDMIIDTFGTRFVIHAINDNPWLDCQWTFKSPMCGYVGPETNCNKKKERCQELGNFERHGGRSGIFGDEIVCPFCQTPQRSTLVYGKIRTICKSCDKEFEVERKV